MKRPASSVHSLGPLCFARAFAVAVLAIAIVATAVSPSVLAQEPEDPTDWFDMWDPAWKAREEWAPGEMGEVHRQRMMRHWTFMNQGVPSGYADAENTVGYSIDAITAGSLLYQDQCQRCHGKKGMGDGEKAQDLAPSPALLAFLMPRPIAVDEYLLWTISEGGGAFGTAMPAFKDKLSKDEIWRIIAYMRAGFPTPQQMRSIGSEKAGAKGAEKEKSTAPEGATPAQ